jgi:hypothetical protein
MDLDYDSEFHDFLSLDAAPDGTTFWLLKSTPWDTLVNRALTVKRLEKCQISRAGSYPAIVVVLLVVECPSGPQCTTCSPRYPLKCIPILHLLETTQ